MQRQEACLRTRTIRKDLLVGRTHANTHIKIISDQYIWRGAYIQGAYNNCNHSEGFFLFTGRLQVDGL